MTNVNTNGPASKSDGGPGLKGSNFLRGALLAIAGVSQALAATTGDSPGEDVASSAWYASAVCGRDLTSLDYPASHSPAATGFDAASTDLIALYDLRLPKIYSGDEKTRYADLPVRLMDVSAYASLDFTYDDFKQSNYQIGAKAGFSRAGSAICTDKLNEYSLTTVDWTRPLDAIAGSARSDEWHRLKYGYLSTTNTNWTIGARLSF
jgi:hypothetical protein